jgi:Transposase IS66 family
VSTIGFFPKPFLAERRVNEFNRIFTQITGYSELDKALKRLHDNKKELLLVLKYPHIPLHNNDSERDIRE